MFGRSKRRLRLLEHLLRSEFNGEGELLKAYSIGLDIFGKSEDFDPSTDSIVRVEVGRLRTVLALFEASEFATTKLKLEIPVGTYRPLLLNRHAVDDVHMGDTGNSNGHRPHDEQAVRQSNRIPRALVAVAAIASVAMLIWFTLFDVARTRPAIGVQINDVTGSKNAASIVKTALRRALSRSNTIKVLDPIGERGLHLDASFVVSSQIVDGTSGRQVIAELRDAISGRVLWGKAIRVSPEIDLSQDIEMKLARELRVRLFGASKEVLEALDPDELSSEELFVLATWVPGAAESAITWESTRVEYAQKALERDPNYGAAHSVLADKLAYLANVYAPADTPENRTSALKHARRAMELAPLDPDVVFNVAQSHWHSGRISESRAAMARVIELDPSHDVAQFLTKVIPYTCAVAPDAVLEEVITFDENLSPDNPIRWLTLTWVGWLHAYREEWQAALDAEEASARIFQVPYTFMRRAMILNKLGRRDAAAAVIDQQKKNWSAFEPRHFATSTIPRLCTESDMPERFVSYYVGLVENL